MFFRDPPLWEDILDHLPELERRINDRILGDPGPTASHGDPT